MSSAIHQDFERVYAQTSYQGHFRKVLHVVTAPGFQAILGYRITRWLMEHRVPLIGLLTQRLVEVWTGISIPPAAQIGPGLLIHHFGGIIINGEAVIGSHCDLHHGVTVGNQNSGGPSPKIGDHVMIGAGAKVLGGITIGNDVEIGANAVVLQDVPDGGVAVGVPAKVVRLKTQMVTT